MEELLTDVTAAVHRAGKALLAEYTESARPADRNDMARGGRHLDAIVTAILEPALSAIRPDARWVGDDQEMTVLPPGEWWAVDPIEGGVNYVHGMDQWAVTVALVRDNVPVLAVVYEPVPDRTWTAVRGGGAYVNGQPLGVSAKKAVDAAIVTMTQPRTKNREFGAAVAALLDRALFVRSTVPSTFPQLDLAAGHVDVYWQYECDLIGVAAGVLLVTEAGGVVTNLRGTAWQPGDADILAAAPGLHEAFLSILREI
ncbi:inositol monophosphatase [Kutzneria buriramensis]|uniref:Myo-inositol-1(Or 4)-monophosphatase n=1 Tax=Kutzneria buriramensis TaxID=1045776 RepID=A0A3E0I027_9PSEU|nr:inositol monophosphatase [Kutzneria buriramensis]REH51555.1 myo-inositol-1(or 4)-monophosphatase [Kutzneria buriramensis]